MTVVRAWCTTCGDVALADGARTVVLRVCLDWPHAEYRFWCPGCARVSAVSASQQQLAILQDIGCATEAWRLPRELFEPVPAGAAFTPDDVLDWHLALVVVVGVDDLEYA